MKPDKNLVWQAHLTRPDQTQILGSGYPVSTLLCGGYNYDSTSIRRLFDGRSTVYETSLRSQWRKLPASGSHADPFVHLGRRHRRIAVEWESSGSCVTTALWCCRAWDVRHGGAVEAGGRERQPAGVGPVPSGLAAGGAVRVARHVPHIQQDSVALAPAVHLLRAAQRRVTAAQLRRLRRHHRPRRQHAERRPPATGRQDVGPSHRRRAPPLPRSDLDPTNSWRGNLETPKLTTLGMRGVADPLETC